MTIWELIRSARGLLLNLKDRRSSKRLKGTMIFQKILELPKKQHRLIWELTNCLEKRPKANKNGCMISQNRTRWSSVLCQGNSLKLRKETMKRICRVQGLVLMVRPRSAWVNLKLICPAASKFKTNVFWIRSKLHFLTQTKEGRKRHFKGIPQHKVIEVYHLIPRIQWRPMRNLRPRKIKRIRQRATLIKLCWKNQS